ncbi:cilia- and flagella-associated protein 157-like [Linepithema humile]|uniref:cilia- and flagella-associated protein 157-like n=1 Tax=Linepithema humile TaxID=83485 RepID=UPI0006234817|nr:PREDICTED: uncharacterized protein PFB0765w-like [Linepithema humile]
MDLYKKKNVPSIRSRNFDETKLKNVIINTQKSFYTLQIAETNKRIERLEKRNKELEDNLRDLDYSIQTLQKEKAQEISSMNAQITSNVIKIENYKRHLTALEKSMTEDKFAYIRNVTNIDEKYKNARFTLLSQMKCLRSKINVLEDYKSMQDILKKKLNMQNQSLIHETEQMAESLHQIEYKFKIDTEKLKKELYKHLLDLTGVFQLEISQYILPPIARLLLENVAVHNKLLTISETHENNNQNNIQHKNAIKKYKREINDNHLSAKHSVGSTKIEKSVVTILRKTYDETNVNLSKLIKPRLITRFMEQQYITNKDNALIKAQKCEAHVKHLEILLYLEKMKLSIAENQKRWISNQLQKQLQSFYDIKCALTNLNAERMTSNDEEKNCL